MILLVIQVKMVTNIYFQGSFLGKEIELFNLVKNLIITIVNTLLLSKIYPKITPLLFSSVLGLAYVKLHNGPDKIAIIFFSVSWVYALSIFWVAS